MKREFNVAGLLVIGCSFCLYSANMNVTTNSDSGPGSLRQAIMDINSGSDGSNTINMQIPGNNPISVGSDLPVIKKNTIINSTGKQPIDGNGQYRLFATIMADLTLNNCKLQNGAAIGGDGGGGGMGAGGGVYIDRGNTLLLVSSVINSCKAQGGKDLNDSIGGGGASFSTAAKQGQGKGQGGGDYPGILMASGQYDGSSFLIGYGGGNVYSKGGGNGPAIKNDGGYCGGNGATGGGGNGGDIVGHNYGGGGFGSGGGRYGGGGGFGGGGVLWGIWRRCIII